MDSAFTWSWQWCRVWLSSGSWKSLPSIWGECVPRSLRDIPPTQRFNPVPTVCKFCIWLKHSYFNKIGITSTREMGRSVVKKAGIKVLEMLFSLIKIPYGYLSAEIWNGGGRWEENFVLTRVGRLCSTEIFCLLCSHEPSSSCPLQLQLLCKLYLWFFCL